MIADKVKSLMDAQSKLASSDQHFAYSLISNFNRYGRLSEKQLAWVDTLVARAMAPRPAPTVTETVNFQAIQAIFDLASQKLRRVKIKLQAPNGTPVTFARAGGMSKYAGQIMITDGLPFGQNRYFGRISTDGSFFGTSIANEDVVNLVKDFANDPAGTAGKYGRLTGGCSFCNHSLKDDRSVQVGYGPVCAKNFGLSWG